MSMISTQPLVPTAASVSDAEWWRDAVVYQAYVRSFRDGNGDGIGDFAGLLAGLDAIAELGCDAVWLNPCYRSPQRDHGYDIADYRQIDPSYGTLEEFDAFLDEAHRLGIRVVMDMVANHCSTEHPWFQAALAGEPGGPERARFHFRDGQGADGSVPPGNWQSVFGGSAWSRITEPDGTPGQWYLHSFDSGQPDFDWRNPEVADEFADVLRFWFDRGVDGFRIDVAHGHVKADGLPDWPGADDGTGGHNAAMWDQPEVHDIYRRWRAIAEEYEPARYLVGEIWVPSTERLAAYLRPDELHQAFRFDLLVQPWDASRLRAAVQTGLDAAAQPPAWALANHDVHRTVTRYGQEQILEAPDPSDMIAAARRRGSVDVELGVRRARAAAALMLALPGAAYLYQGEELGLPEVFDLPDSARQDPIWLRSDGAELGRDGCRVPLPWEPHGASAGFSNGPDAWLPQPTWFAQFARSIQRADPNSSLSVYRDLTHRRRSLFGSDATLTWLDPGVTGVLAFRRGRGICVLNTTCSAYPLPPAWRPWDPVVCTAPVTVAGEVPPDAAAWFASPELRIPSPTDAPASPDTKEQ